MGPSTGGVPHPGTCSHSKFVSACLSGCLFARLPATLPACLYACLVSLSVCLSVCCLSVCLSVFSVCPSSLSVCLSSVSVCLCARAVLPCALHQKSELLLTHNFNSSKAYPHAVTAVCGADLPDLQELLGLSIDLWPADPNSQRDSRG